MRQTAIDVSKLEEHEWWDRTRRVVKYLRRVLVDPPSLPVLYQTNFFSFLLWSYYTFEMFTKKISQHSGNIQDGVQNV